MVCALRLVNGAHRTMGRCCWGAFRSDRVPFGEGAEVLGGGPVGGVGAVSELEPCVVVDRDADEEHASLSVGPVRCLDRGVYGGVGGESSEVLADRRSRRFGSPLERLPMPPVSTSIRTGRCAVRPASRDAQ